MPDLEQQYHRLGLESDASMDDVKQAYRDLAQVWHPDRFSHDDRLRQKALETLQEINAAFQVVRKDAARRRRRRSMTAVRSFGRRLTGVFVGGTSRRNRFSRVLGLDRVEPREPAAGARAVWWVGLTALALALAVLAVSLWALG